MTGVADDPEAADVLGDCMERWRALPHATRSRVHLACVPMHDPDENAAIVNALQRRAAIIVQKSLAEGFGLTVAEAMWKQRADRGERGRRHRRPDRGRRRRACCWRTPPTSPASGRRSSGSCAIRTRRARMGADARRRATEQFLGDRHLEQYAELFAGLA